MTLYCVTMSVLEIEKKNFEIEKKQNKTKAMSILDNNTLVTLFLVKFKTPIRNLTKTL